MSDMLTLDVIVSDNVPQDQVLSDLIQQFREAAAKLKSSEGTKHQINIFESCEISCRIFEHVYTSLVIGRNELEEIVNLFRSATDSMDIECSDDLSMFYRRNVLNRAADLDDMLATKKVVVLTS